MSRQSNALKFLATARQAYDIDTEASGVYLIALADVDPAALERACHELARRPRREFEPAMPSVGTIRALAEQLAREDAEAAHLRQLPPDPVRDEDGPRYYCRDCHDGDWGPALWCPGTDREAQHPRHVGAERVLCGRPGPHAAHTFVQRCHCWGTNAVVERRRLAQRPGAGRAA